MEGVGRNKQTPRKKVCFWMKNKRLRRELKCYSLGAITTVFARRRIVSGWKNKRSQERLKFQNQSFRLEKQAFPNRMEIECGKWIV